MVDGLTRAVYLDLKSLARRHARGRMDAGDLLQEALLACVTAGHELSRLERAWLGGVMRNIALMNARGASRRRHREGRYAHTQPDPSPEMIMPELSGLSPSLRIVALLALAGHNRAEIRSLLRISDEALRQRIAGVRRHLKTRGESKQDSFPVLRGSLAFGALRRSLLPLVVRGRADLASHDPDGHLIAVRFFSTRPHKNDVGGNRQMKAASRR